MTQLRRSLGATRTAIRASELRPVPADITEEYNLAFGLNQPTEVRLTEAWFMALRRAKRQFVREYDRCADELVFTQEEAERVAALPQMREHVEVWRKHVGAHAVLPVGLPNMLYGLRVSVG